MKKHIFFTGITIALLAISIIAGCKKNKDEGSPGENEIWLQNTAFKPAEITVSAGTTITWTNKDKDTHTVSENNTLFKSGDMAKDDTFNYQFNNAGTYDINCKYHANMKGKVIVQ